MNKEERKLVKSTDYSIVRQIQQIVDEADPFLLEAYMAKTVEELYETRELLFEEMLIARRLGKDIAFVKKALDLASALITTKEMKDGEEKKGVILT